MRAKLTTILTLWRPQPRQTRLLGLAALALGGALVCPLRVGVVCGESMHPTFQNGQVYMLDRRTTPREPVRRGEVVIFRHNARTYMKRVAAVEGDSIYLLKLQGAPEDDLIMNWQLSHVRSAASRPLWRHTMKVVERRVPPGYCYVLGDNLSSSIDSRNFGLVPVDEIHGRVMAPRPPDTPLEHLAGHFRSEPSS